MKISELKRELLKFPTAHLRFMLPSGEAIPAHAHVTEVARIDKRFIDCGGALRNETHCRLQTWYSDDLDHRLTAGKLSKILDLAASVLGSDDMEVDVEHELDFITQFPLGTVEARADEIVLRLSERHTACLAPEKCKPPTTAVRDFNPMKLDFKQKQQASSCCSPNEDLT